jgi:hypothetical protein
MLKTRSTQHKVNQDCYAIVMKTLIAWPSDCYKLEKKSGLALTTVQDLMRCFHRKGVVFIAGWNKDTMGRATTPIFALKLKATDTDVPRPKLTPAQRQARYKAKKLKEKEQSCAPVPQSSSQS